MAAHGQLDLKPLLTPGSQVIETQPGTWRLEIPAGRKGSYRLAQLDDYHTLKRPDFPWRLTGAGDRIRLNLQARASASQLPGTWGFGLWNDPFSFSLGMGGASQRFPALPETAWYFFASPPNYLSFYDHLPAQGALAATFHSPPWPAWQLALAAPALGLFMLPPLGRWLRRFARRWIKQDAAQLTIDPTGWHSYAIEWSLAQVLFQVDDIPVLATKVAPHGPLSLVLWIDNQYAALPPNGRLGYGTLESPAPSWIELAHIQCEYRSMEVNNA